MSATITVRLEEDKKALLESIAKSTQRTKAWLATQAINEYLEREAAQIKAIEEAVKQADSPNAVLIDNDKVMAWLDSWGIENELPAPCK